MLEQRKLVGALSIEAIVLAKLRGTIRLVCGLRYSLVEISDLYLSTRSKPSD
jgi:hypothetical protein